VLTNLLAALCRRELISVDVAASLGDGLHSHDLTPTVVSLFVTRIQCVQEDEADTLFGKKD
jgi:hypothetical protein